MFLSSHTSKVLRIFPIIDILRIEALESFVCDVIEIQIKTRIAKRSGKGNQPLNIKTAVERPILKLGLPNFRWSFYFILLLVASILFRHILMTSHMTLSSTLKKQIINSIIGPILIQSGNNPTTLLIRKFRPGRFGGVPFFSYYIAFDKLFQVMLG